MTDVLQDAIAEAEGSATATDPVAAARLERKRTRDRERKQQIKAAGGRKGPAKDRRTEAFWRKKLLGDAPPDVPGLEDVPASLRGGPVRDKGPKRERVKVTAGQEARELREQMAQLLAVMNTGFLAVTPCTCTTVIPDALRNAVHLETCARMWALDDDELTKLADALAVEIEANPGLGEAVMTRFSAWAPHITLAMILFTIVSSRMNRKPNLVVVRQLSNEETATLSIWAASRQTPQDERPTADNNGRGPFPATEEAPPAAMPE